MELKYIKTGDYELPNLTLKGNKKGTINKYGMLRLDYLKEHYGLILNEDLYFISYEYEGENLMPNIYVYRKGEDV